MKVLLCVFLLILGFTQTYAKTILISDIDDTIKNSHVLNKADAVLNAGAIENLVLGMNQAYAFVKLKDSDIHFFYITNAPKFFMEKSHRDFLALHRFPEGVVDLRENESQDDFKIVQIRKVLEEERPETVIFVGDNGEKDILVYSQMQKEYPQISFFTYIHLIYSSISEDERGSLILPGQVGFATSLDLILQLRKEGFVSNSDTLSFISSFTHAYEEESGMTDNGPLVFPYWSDCSDLIWTAPDEDFLGLSNYVAAKERIFRRCDLEK
ncbi:MAG: phosphatase domain-containing protein [Pseudobdellovibrionaceae bacterium]